MQSTLAAITLTTAQTVLIIIATAGGIGVGVFRFVARKLRERNSKESSIDDTVKAMWGEPKSRTRPDGTPGVYASVQKLSEGFPLLKTAVDELKTWQREHDERLAREKKP